MSANYVLVLFNANYAAGLVNPVNIAQDIMEICI